MTLTLYQTMVQVTTRIRTIIQQNHKNQVLGVLYALLGVLYTGISSGLLHYAPVYGCFRQDFYFWHFGVLTRTEHPGLTRYQINSFNYLPNHKHTQIDDWKHVLTSMLDQRKQFTY
jgi:hypothetical protein